MMKLMEGGELGYEQLQREFQQQNRTLPTARGMRTVHLRVISAGVSIGSNMLQM